MLKVRVYFYRKEIAMIQLEKLVKKNLPKEKEGKVASYIPALAEVNPKQLGVALYDLEDGEVGEAGQSEVRFAIESISKVITCVSALIAMHICPVAGDYILASHVSKEPAAHLILEHMKKEAILHADMCLGEGTGAVALFPILDLAAAVYHSMSTFEDINVEQYEELK